MTYITVVREVARELAYTGTGRTIDGYEVVENRHTGERRWVSEHELVIRTGGNLYRAYYELGLTEYQDTRPFEDDGPLITFNEVTRVAVEHFEYKEAA
jgi:hypothetical protein